MAFPAVAVALAACAPSPESNTLQSRGVASSAPAVSAPVATAPIAAPASTNTAALGPIPEAVPVTDRPLPSSTAPDSPMEAVGRRTLSTAFVRVGPDGRIAVELRTGERLALRDLTMGKKEYCAAVTDGPRAGKRYCGGYAEVAAAWPGDAPGR